MEFKAKTVEEAKEIGLKELNLTEEEAEIEVIQTAGLFKKAIVKITKKEYTAPTEQDIEESVLVENIEEVEENNENTTENAIEEKPIKIHEIDVPVVNFLQSVLDKMQLNCTLSIKSNRDLLHIIIKGEDTHFVIGYRGETLDSLQYLCLLYANKNTRFKKRLVIDAEGYRDLRAKTLTDLSLKLARKVAKTGNSIELEPMNPFERRVIHTALQNDKYVKTSSEGEEPNRYVVISPIPKEELYYDSETRYNFKKNGIGKTRSFGQKNRRF